MYLDIDVGACVVVCVKGNVRGEQAIVITWHISWSNGSTIPCSDAIEVIEALRMVAGDELIGSGIECLSHRLREQAGGDQENEQWFELCHHRFIVFLSPY